MVKGRKPNTVVEVAPATSTPPDEPSCINCAFSKFTGNNLICGFRFPNFVRRSERTADYIVRNTDYCDLHKRTD